MSNFANVCGLHMGHVFFCPASINYALFQSASIPASGVCEHCATWQGNPPQSESLHQSHHGNSANQMNCSERMGSPSKKMISDWISGPKPIQTYSLWSSSPASLALPASSAFEDSPGGSALIGLLTSDTPTAWLGAATCGCPISCDSERAATTNSLDYYGYCLIQATLESQNSEAKLWTF